jgi:hypothetical protein
MSSYQPKKKMTLDDMRRSVGLPVPGPSPQEKTKVEHKDEKDPDVILLEDPDDGKDVVMKTDNDMSINQPKCRQPAETKYDPELLKHKIPTLVGYLFDACRQMAGDATWKGDLTGYWNYEALAKEPSLVTKIQPNNLDEYLARLLQPVALAGVNQTVALIQSVAPKQSLASILSTPKTRTAFASLAANVIRRNHGLIQLIEPLGHNQRGVHALQLSMATANQIIEQWLDIFRD